MTGYLDEVNRTKVSVNLLIEIVQMRAEMTPEDRSVFEACAFQIFELLKWKRFRTRKIVARATAIHFRLTALARLERAAALKGWSIPRAPGVSPISIDALRAAAEEPLVRMWKVKLRLILKVSAVAF